MRGNKEQYEQLQQEIVRSSLADYQAWVSGLADEMQTANAYGNTREVHRIVKKKCSSTGTPTHQPKQRQGWQAAEQCELCGTGMDEISGK